MFARIAARSRVPARYWMYWKTKSIPTTALIAMPTNPLTNRTYEMARNIQLDEFIAELQALRARWGNTCVHIRQGGLTWGAEALHASGDDRKGIVTALLNLANAADAVGVTYFDTDTMEPEVEAMQTATKAARAALEL